MIDKVGHLIYPDGQNRGRGPGELDRGQYDHARRCSGRTAAPACTAGRCSTRSADSTRISSPTATTPTSDCARESPVGAPLRARSGVLHHRGATLGQLNPQRVTLIERNRVLLAVKLFPGSLLCLNGVFYLARVAGAAWRH